MNFSLYLAFTAGVLQLIAHIPIIRGTIKRVTKPSTTATGIWTFVGAAVLASSYYSGVRTNLPFIVAGTTATGIVFLLSLKYGYRRWSVIDPVCLIIATASLLTWYTTKNSSYAVYLLVLIDWVAIIPVLRKSWLDPETENKPGWTINFFACCLLVLSVRDWRIVVSCLALTQIAHSIIVNSMIRFSPNKIKPME